METAAQLSSVLSLAAVFDHLRRVGVRPEAVADTAIIAMATEGDTDARVPTRIVLELLERCSAALDDPLFGLRYAQSIAPEAFGVVGHFWKNAPSLRYCHEVTARFLHLQHGGLAASLQVENETAMFVQRLDVALRPQGRQAIESNISFSLRISRWILGPHWAPLRVTFMHEPACAPSAYAKVLGAPVEFGAEEDALIVKRSDLDRSSYDRDRIQIHSMERRLLVRAIREPLAFKERAEQVIDELISAGSPFVSSAARAMGLSSRTFQRRLKATGTSFQTLLCERRLGIIKRERMRSSHVPLALLAQKTSLSDASAVSRLLRTRVG